MPQSHVQDHVELIAKHEQEFLARRTLWERATDRSAVFIGSAGFIGVHLALFASWVLLNTLPHLDHFDPRPFALLQTIMACEAILVASFILMRQTRLGKRSDERDHLMLQILLLTEKELTAMLGLNREIDSEVGLEREANTRELREMSQPTRIDEVAQTIKENVPEG
jgi:uncharacterized membrane protein